MAVSTVQYDVILNVGEVKLKFHTRDGGKHLDFIEVAKLPEGVSKEGFQYVVNKLLRMARAETERLADAQAEAAEARAKAKEAETARILAAEAENQRKQRRQAFELLTKDQTQPPVEFNPEIHWRTSNRRLAESVAAHDILPFLGVNGAGTPAVAFIFSDPEHVGEKLCPKCLKPALWRGKKSFRYGTVPIQCDACGMHDYVFEGLDPAQGRRGVILHSV